MSLRQLYIKRNNYSKIILIAAKVTDDILLAGLIPKQTAFPKAISSRYKIRNTIIDGDIQFNGWDVSQDQRGHIIMTIARFFSKKIPIFMNKN